MAKYSKKQKKEESPISDSLYSYISQKFDDAKADRTTWTDKQIKYHKLRMRIKKSKTFPFVGCSNIRMPTAEIKIRKVKAAIYNVLFGIRPIVQAVPPPSGRFETALKIEKFLDHLLCDVIEIQKKAVVAIDQELEQGFYILKPYWRFEVNKRQEEFDLGDISIEEAKFLYSGSTTKEDIVGFLKQKYDVDNNDKIAAENDTELYKVADKIMAGETDFDFYLQDVLFDIPDVALVSPEHCYVPAETGWNPQDAQCIIHEFFMPLQQLKQKSEWAGWDIDGIKEINDYKSQEVDYQKEQNKDLQEGITRLQNSSELVRIWEYYGWYDLNGDGVKEKVVITCAPDFQKVLRKMGLPFYNGKYPFVKLFYELTDDRWYSHRGVPEIGEDIIKEIDVQHNMKIDQQTIRNAPMFVYRSGMINPNLVQMIPNQAIPVNGLQPLRDTIDVLNNSNSNVEFSYVQEQQILEGKLEELYGQPDYNLQSQINRRQPRTLGEVQLQSQSMQTTFSLDASLHTMQFTELVNFIWDLWCQYGSDDYEFNYFGENGWEKIKLTKEEIQGRYKISIRGNDKNTNPQERMQKAQQILLTLSSPSLLQSGVIKAPQMISALKRFYQYLDVENWEELINTQIEPPQPPPVGSLIKPNFDSLTDAEKSQVLQSVGVSPDAQGRMMEKEREVIGMMRGKANG